ncbi:MAG: winged helix-turn-helix transcriptional regulator, partial [Lentisphaeria bacterium]|nr:winged helix-turn-helix transcriptional regulator [Lentisphaeria bacterium]
MTEKIYKTLFEEILEGKYSPGSRIPTEFETAARFKASRVTVRRAYAILEQAGIIIRKPRCGTVVSENFSGSTEPIRIIAAVMPLNDDFAREFLHTLCKEAANLLHKRFQSSRTGKVYEIVAIKEYIGFETNIRIHLKDLNKK